MSLKLIRAAAAPEERACFEQKYRLLTTLSHPNVVSPLNFGVHPQGAHFAIEHLDGHLLGDSPRVPWRQACRWLRDLASALALLHARGLLLGNLGPDSVWQAASGRVRLFDLSAVKRLDSEVREGRSSPPLSASEAMHGHALDQRADLYALGALGFWMLTGEHPEASSSDRPRRSIAELLAACGAPAETLPPATLQALFDALLSSNPMARPERAGEVIARLQVLADLPPESDAGSGYVECTPLVGHTAELTALNEALDAARHGHGDVLVLSGAPGVGCSRLLDELCLDARLEGALVTSCRQFGEPRGYGLIEAAGIELLETAPELAAVEAEPYADILAAVSPRLAGALGRDPSRWSPSVRESAAGRFDILRAAKAWFLAMSAERPLVLAIDDLARVDEVSLAWMNGLGAEAHQHALLVVGARSNAPGASQADVPAGAGHDEGELAALEKLSRRARAIDVLPITQGEVHGLIESMFGGALHQRRLSERLYRATLGNPAHIRAVVKNLIREKRIYYAAGSWYLPTELSAEEIPTTRRAALLTQLAALGDDERALAQVLSIHGGLVPREAIAHLSEFDLARTEELGGALVKSGVAQSVAGGLRIVSPIVREELLRELGDGARRRRAHAQLAKSILRTKPLTELDRLRAGAHFLRAGEDRAGASLVVQASTHLQGSAAHLDAVPYLEDAIALMRERVFSEHELLAPMARLATASYYCDRRLAQRYGWDALAALERSLKLSLARRLTPSLGSKVSLYVALLLAAFSFLRHKRNPCVPSLRETLELLFSAAAGLTGVHTVCVDPMSAQRCASVLSPFGALGIDHVAGFSYAYCSAFAITTQERLGEALAAWHPLVRRLQVDPPIRGMRPNIKNDFLAGGLYAFGALYTLAESPRALLVAQELERLDEGMYAMAADQIRSVYQENRGKRALAEEYRQRVEGHAITRGSAWQVETWAAAASIAVQTRSEDRAGMKRNCEQLRRLQPEIPSFHTLLRRADATLLLISGHTREALPGLEACLAEPPREIVGWVRAHASLARAYNELGEHQRAREVVESVRARVPPDDLTFPMQHLSLHIEGALAEAGLGNYQAATAQLEHWMQRYQSSDVPLTRGALHEARARVALMEGDMPAFERHLRRMQNWYLPTALPELVQRCQRLAKQRPPSVGLAHAQVFGAAS